MEAKCKQVVPYIESKLEILDKIYKGVNFITLAEECNAGNSAISYIKRQRERTFCLRGQGHTLAEIRVCHEEGRTPRAMCLWLTQEKGKVLYKRHDGDGEGQDDL